MFTSIDTIRTDILAGDATIGVAHVLYDLTAADGSRRVAGQITASRWRGTGAEHTTFAECDREAAIRWHHMGDEAPRPGTTSDPTVLWTSADGTLRITWEDPTLEERTALAEDLARWAGEEAERAHDEDVASLPEGQHYTRCCEQAREDGARNEYAFAMKLPIDVLSRRHADELEERTGWGQPTEDERAAYLATPDGGAPPEGWNVIMFGWPAGDADRAGQVWTDSYGRRHLMIDHGTALVCSRPASRPSSIAAELASMSPDDRAVAERIADLGDVEPAPGYEERAVERASLEGVLPPTS